MVRAIPDNRVKFQVHLIRTIQDLTLHFALTLNRHIISRTPPALEPISSVASQKSDLPRPQVPRPVTGLTERTTLQMKPDCSQIGLAPVWRDVQIIYNRFEGTPFHPNCGLPHNTPSFSVTLLNVHRLRKTAILPTSVAERERIANLLKVNVPCLVHDVLLRRPVVTTLMVWRTERTTSRAEAMAFEGKLQCRLPDWSVFSRHASLLA